MKRIIINRMQFLNFKGLRELSIEFNEDITSILGRNGSGKTSVFDGFTWLLFGKNSEDRKSFNIKTLDETGRAIERLPHEVSAALTVDGQSITLCRRFCEKWVKQRGSAVEEFKGHEEERLFNDVPCSLKEWNEKIAEMFCDEQVFKMLTNPLYFTAQKTDVQRAMLFRMAGEISDEEIAEQSEDFKKLLAELTGKTLDEYKREIAAKKRRVKAELDAIPARLDERKRDASTLASCLSDEPVSDIDKYCSVIEKQLAEAQSELASVEKQMSDVFAAYKEADKQHTARLQRVSELNRQLMQRENEVEKQLLSEYHSIVKKNSETRLNISNHKSELRSLVSRKSYIEENIKTLTEKRNALREEWHKKNSETLVFDDNDFICPTCKRRFDIDEIEARQSEMTENFNRAKTEALAAISARGKKVAAQIADSQKELDDVLMRTAQTEALIKQLESEILAEQQPATADDVAKDETVIALKQQLSEAKEAAQTEIDVKSDDIELQERKAKLIEKIDDFKSRLLTRDGIKRNNARVAELETLMRSQSEELAQLEDVEFTISAFSKARIEAVEARINGLFSLVRFKMFEQQINGGEIETCEATVNGTPFSDLNNAMRINAGLDIVNAICKSENITAPIFIDNAEAVNELLKTDAQMIRLVVTEDNGLTIQ